MRAIRNGGAPHHFTDADAHALERRHGSDFLSVNTLTAKHCPSASSCGPLEAQSEDLFVLAMEALAGAVTTAMSVSMSNAGSGIPGVTMACMPLFFPQWFGVSQNAANGGGPESSGSSATTAGPESELQLAARHCENKQMVLFLTCAAQAAAAACSFALKDSLSGFIGLGISFLGVQAATLNGQRFLPSYVVLSFCNGTMQVLLAAEMTSHAASQLASGHSLWIKAASLVCMATPGLMFAGMFFGWQLFKELRMLRALAGMPASEAVSTLDFGGAPASAGTHGAPGSAAAGQRQGGQSSPFRPFVGNHYRLAEVPGKKETNPASEDRLIQDLNTSSA